MKKITYILFGLLMSPYVVADYKIYGAAKNTISIPKETGSQPVLGTNGFQLDANGVTISCDAATPGDTGVVNGVTYTAVDNNTLGNYGYVTKCTSYVTNMSEIFLNEITFNGDISSWDTSNVITMYYMLTSASFFNQDISDWDTSNVKDMRHMFQGATNFNQDISNWDTGNVEKMSYMFYYASGFNKDISSWDVSNVIEHDLFARESGIEGFPSKQPDFP